MTDTEKEIKHRERQLTECKNELELLEKDHRIVKSDRSKKAIEDIIFILMKRKEDLEFKLWKLKR